MTKRKVRRFTAERREAFLAHLRRSGNQAAAARSIGFDRTVPERRRRRDAAFELECRAALAEASARLAGATDPFAHDGDAAFETIRRTSHGRVQIVATRKWSKRAEDMFLDILRGCGNVAAAARAMGFSESLIWQRRRKWAEFAQRMETALEEAELVLEYRLATHGIDRCSMGGEGEIVDPEMAAADALEAEALRPRFDPEFSLRFLKWREEKRRKPGLGRHREGPPDIDAMCARVLRQIMAIKRHSQRQQLAEGWRRDAETGRMIPPGWVQVDRPDGEDLCEPGEAS